MFTMRQRVYMFLIAILAGMVIGFIQMKTQSIHVADQSVAPAPLAGIPLGGAFKLTDQDGKTVTEKSWPGQYLLIYFGFTHCPDICPLGLTKIAEALQVLPKETAAKIQPMLITVDPARDTAAELKAYVTLFYPTMIGLTGTQDQIDAVLKSFRVYAQKQIITDDQGGDQKNYMMNHSSFTYLIAPSGDKVIDVFAHDATAADIAEKLKVQIK
jgi:protein SCO1/2